MAPISQPTSPGLERLGRCPICAGTERTPAYSRVKDLMLGTPGEWDYWSCSCGILYLDPRPSRGALPSAYSDYYTHFSRGAPLRWRDPGFRGSVRRGYLNRRFGYRFPKASLLGGLTWRLRASSVKNLDFMIRHLPAPDGPGRRILDIGCGNGDFLAVAEDLGFEAAGVDFDPAAVDFARSRGLDARLGSLPGSGLPLASFDHVFMSHVLEHLHDPRGALQEARALLVPDGRLWLSLPNIGSQGLARFGRHWRGLEPPRHLVLFDADTLAALVAGTGFERATLLPPEEAAFFYFRQSSAIACGLDPNCKTNPPEWHTLRSAAAAANRRARSEPRSAETLTMVAWNPAERGESPAP